MMYKKAILAVSFGTSYKDTRERTIDRIEADMKAAYPDYGIYRAFTSKMIIRILKNRDNIIVMTVKEALEQMKRDGIREVIVQPTHILNGIENDGMIKEVNLYKNQFDSVKIGTPLLTEHSDYEYLIKEFIGKLPALKKEEALVFMGHGTPHYSNTSYAALEYMLRDYGYEDIYIATVEAYPELNQVIRQIKKKNYKKVLLAPLMVVSGDHARNDMAGEEEDSWKSILMQEGYEVSCNLKGLGEYGSIRKLFLKHVADAAIVE